MRAARGGARPTESGTLPAQAGDTAVTPAAAEGAWSAQAGFTAPKPVAVAPPGALPGATPPHRGYLGTPHRAPPG